jgi:hypothetical protein
MARYKTHIIVYGDTPQIIAEREMGDVSQWIKLVSSNNLHYPYIVDTDEEKSVDPNHLVTLGDTIIIPIEKTLADVDTNRLSKHDKKELVDIVLGSDLQLDLYQHKEDIHGTDDGILELTGNGKGDIKLAKGLENIKQMLLLRLLTPKGSLPLHPDYGSDIQEIIGNKNTVETANMLNTTIENCLDADSRILNSALDRYTIDDTYYTSSWDIKLQSFDTYFKLLIQRDNNNNFTIL